MNIWLEMGRNKREFPVGTRVRVKPKYRWHTDESHSGIVDGHLTKFVSDGTIAAISIVMDRGDVTVVARGHQLERE